MPVTTRYNPQADFLSIPDIPTGIVLPPYWSIVVPINRDVTNIITNPSFETNTTSWLATSTGSISRVTERSYYGAYSLKVTPGTGAADDGAEWGSFTASVGNSYAFSVRFLGVGGRRYRLAFISAGATIDRYEFTATGFWQYVYVSHTERGAGGSQQVRVLRIGNLNTNPFYIDGAQLEEYTSSQLIIPTTYIDGDQLGLTPNEYPVPYYWTGTPHASTSVRSGSTRSGGEVKKLRDLGLMVMAMTGLGLSSPLHTTLPLGQLDGEVYQRSQKNARIFTLAGRTGGRSAVQQDTTFSGFSSLLDINATARQEPMILKYQPLDECAVPTGPELDIVCTYEGGMEGNRTNLATDEFTATFKQYFPTILSHTEGATLSTGVAVTNDNAALRRLPSGTWAAVDTGFTGGLQRIIAIAQHPDGTVYFGGDFTAAGSSGADYAAKYNPTTNTLSVIKAATSFNNVVRSIVIGPTGLVYFGGDFTNVDAIANADGIVQYNPTTDTFTALGTGVAAGGTVHAMDFDSSGNLYAGGNFTLMGGVANTVDIAKWNGSAWSAMGTGVTAGTDVRSIRVIRSNVFAGGDFTGMGGVANTTRLARWDGTAWNAMSTGANANVLALQKGPDGLLYIGGAFTTLGGASMISIGRWNGVTYQTVGSASALNNTVYSIEFDVGGTMYIAGEFSTVDGISVDDSVAKFDGGTYTPLGVDLAATGPVFKILRIPNGTLYIGHEGGGTASASVSTTVTHSGTDKTYPTIIFKGPSSGSSRLFQISNLTTGRSVYFNYTILAGETATFVFDPNHLSFVSDFQGDISYTIMSGSSEADFPLIRGNNVISMLSSQTNVPTAVIFWDQAFLSVSDAVGKV